MKEHSMSIKELTRALDEEISRAFEEYSKLHEEFNAYRGKILLEEDVKSLTLLFDKIQDKFSELFPAYNFIAKRYDHTNNAVNGYESFINELKKAGMLNESNELN